MAEEAARAIVQAHEPELVEWATSNLARRLKGKIDNPAGWLRRAIEEDWRPQPSLFAQEQAQAREAAQAREMRKLELEAKTLNMRKLFNAYAKGALVRYAEVLEGQDRKALEQGFREHLTSAKITPYIAKKFDGGPSWYSDPIITAEAIGYLKATRSDFSPMSLSEFAAQNGVSDFEAIECELRELTAAA